MKRLEAVPRGTVLLLVAAQVVYLYTALFAADAGLKRVALLTLAGLLMGSAGLYMGWRRSQTTRSR